MQIVAFKDALPTPRPNHSRVFRVESVNDPKKGAFGDIGCDVGYWTHMPSPYCDVGIERSIKPHEVCGTEWSTLLQWFPEHVIAKLHAYELQLIALDVPNSHITKGEFQVIFTRAEAVVVAAFQSSGYV